MAGSPNQLSPSDLADRLKAQFGDDITSAEEVHGHPVVTVESFVDPEQFDGAVYRAQGWVELGPTDGWGRCRRDYYVKHNKPKRLFVRELCPNACRRMPSA